MWGNNPWDLQDPPRPSSIMSFKITKLRIEVFVQALFVGISKVNKRYCNGGGHRKNPAMDV